MFIPKLFTCLKGYSKRSFFSDLNAATVVAVIAFPLAIALGISSGVEPGAALYTAVVGCFIVSLLGGSRVQIAGPTGAFVVIVYGIIQKHGISGLFFATILGGMIMIIMGLFRLGTLIKFIPYPITTGFTSGIAVVIFSTQIKDFLGLHVKTGENVPADFIHQWSFYIQHINTINWWAFSISILSFICIMLWPKISKRIPGSLIVVVLATLFSVAMKHISGNDIVDTIGSRFGEIKLSITPFDISAISFDTFKNLLLPSITIAILGSVESLLSAVVADGMIGGNHRSNMELVANGVANIVTGFTGGIPVTGAIARTAANVKNGGRTPIAGICSALILLAISVLFLPLIKLIPMCALAAILVGVAYNMGEWDYFVRFKTIPKSDYFVFIVTFLLTIFFDLVTGILVGLVLAAFLFMKRMVDISDTDLLGQIKDDRYDRPLPAYELPEKTVLYEVRGPFFFGAAEKFGKTMRSFKQEHKIIIMKMDKVPAIDATGLNAFMRFTSDAARGDCKIVVCGLDKQPRQLLVKAGAAVDIVDTIEEAIAKAKELILSL